MIAPQPHPKEMLSTTSSERQQYSAELAAYTLRQFFDARTTLDQHQAAAAKLPAVHNRHLALLHLQGILLYQQTSALTDKEIFTGQNTDHASQTFEHRDDVQGPARQAVPA